MLYVFMCVCGMNCVYVCGVYVLCMWEWHLWYMCDCGGCVCGVKYVCGMCGCGMCVLCTLCVVGVGWWFVFVWCTLCVVGVCWWYVCICVGWWCVCVCVVYAHACVHTYTYTTLCAWMLEDSFPESVLPSHCGLQVSNSGCQACTARAFSHWASC